MRPVGGLRVLIMLAFAVLSSCAGEPPEDPQFPSDVAGTWVRLCPMDGAPDTTVFHRDGTISGSRVALDSLGFEYTEWWIGDALMPGGFCAGPVHRGKPNSCHGYYSTGDTLVFGNEHRTLLVRAGGFRRPDPPLHAELCRAHAARHSPAPAPGAAVRPKASQ